MGSAEITDWIAFDRINPIGDIRLDFLFAKLQQTIAALWGGVDKPLIDYMIEWDEEALKIDTDNELEQAKLAHDLLKVLKAPEGFKI